MKYLVPLIVFFFIILFSKNYAYPINHPLDIQKEYETTKPTAFRGSITNFVFFPLDKIVGLINITYPNETVKVYNEANPELTINTLKDRIDALLENYYSISATTAFYPIDIGSNDVTKAYSSLSLEDIANLNADSDYILNTIEPKGFIPVFLI